MSRRTSFIGVFETFKGESSFIFGRDKSNVTLGRWALARTTQPYIRYDFYMAKLRLDLETYGLAINRQASAQAFPDNKPLITDLVSLNSNLFPWQPTLVLFERSGLLRKSSSEPIHAFDEPQAMLEYGRIAQGLSIFEGPLRSMIERSADPSEVAEVLKIATCGKPSQF